MNPLLRPNSSASTPKNRCTSALICAIVVIGSFLSG
jgi:hypothetical protein